MYLIRSFQKPLLDRLSEPVALIQVLIGPRQVGKTTAAKWIFDQWSGPKLMVSADSPNTHRADWIQVHWNEALSKGANTLLVIDEVQKVPGWSEMIKLIFDPIRGHNQIKVLLLGSSSLTLQRGLSESLAGRFELTQAPHWSYRECHEAFLWDLSTYLKFGAYPGAAAYINDSERWRNYILHSIIEAVIARDILGLNPVHKPALFKQAFELAVHYPSQVVSFQKLLGQLQDRGNAQTIKNYLNLMESAFLLRCIPKYSGSAIQVKSSSPKIVVLNSALTHAYVAQERLSEDPSWYGLMFENMVGAHLARLTHAQLYYWQDRKHEVDFVVKTPRRLYAIEVKSGIGGKQSGLLAFQKEYPDALCQLWDRQRCIEFLEGKITLE